MNVLLDHDRCTLLHGDCRELLEVLPENSVDAIICDPPYLLANASGTGFMGREWDSVKLEPGETVGTASERWHRTWAAVALHVLKPGGHLVAFGGSRTFHRMFSAIEDVGFELRDVLMWLYGSGMPKGIDISKQVDKSDAASERRRRALAFTAWMRTTGLSAARLNAITGTTMGSHYLTDKEQPQIATRELLELIRPHVPSIPDEIEELVGHRVVLSEQFAKREVVGMVELKDSSAAFPGLPGSTWAPMRQVAITEPYTEAAKKWRGWNTTLKPSYEPIALARKPLVDSVAANVLEWGVGGINVDGCRVGERWPANVILDDEASILLDSQGTELTRFFYCAKPTKAEKELGLEIPNTHVTVKPVELMRYLCRLVTPRGGVVLDVFAGSGTTGVAALAEGFGFVGCELGGDDGSHLPILVGRVQHALGTAAPAGA